MSNSASFVPLTLASFQVMSVNCTYIPSEDSLDWTVNLLRHEGNVIPIGALTVRGKNVKIRVIVTGLVRWDKNKIGVDMADDQMCIRVFQEAIALRVLYDAAASAARQMVALVQGDATIPAVAPDPTVDFLDTTQKVKDFTEPV